MFDYLVLAKYGLSEVEEIVLIGYIVKYNCFELTNCLVVAR